MAAAHALQTERKVRVASAWVQAMEIVAAAALAALVAACAPTPTCHAPVFEP